MTFGAILFSIFIASLALGVWALLERKRLTGWALIALSVLSVAGAAELERYEMATRPQFELAGRS